MSETLTSDFKYHPAITAAIIILFICGWSVLYMEVHFDIDIGWLLQCLDRFIAGGTYNDDFYETNPPLSFLIYLPAYPLYSYLGISAKAAVTTLFTIYIAISSLSIYSLIQKSASNKDILTPVYRATPSKLRLSAKIRAKRKKARLMKFFIEIMPSSKV